MKKVSPASEIPFFLSYGGNQRDVYELGFSASPGIASMIAVISS